MIGKPKRRLPKDQSVGGGLPMSRKGIGNLAPFGIARQADVVSVSGGRVNSFTLDLDDLLKNRLERGN
jgi:hypothetical protein